MTEDSPLRTPPDPSTVAQPAAVAPVRIMTEATYPPGTAPPRPPRPTGPAPAPQPSPFSPQSRQAVLALRAATVAAAVAAANAAAAELKKKPRRRLHDFDTDCALGGFQAYGNNCYVRIPEAIYNAKTCASADAWKLLAYLIHRGSLGIMDQLSSRIPTADAVKFLGGRNAAQRVRDAFSELSTAPWTVLDQEHWIMGDGSICLGAHITYNFYGMHFRYPRPAFAGDTDFVKEHRYALVDLRHLRRINNLGHLRFFLFFAYHRRVGERQKNNERWYTIADIAAIADARGKKWGNLQ